MAHIHSCDLIHRDLKSLNVLVNESWVAKIADLGEATAVSRTMTALKGTVIWSAPEVLAGTGHYDNKLDVYSFGIVLWELQTRQVPFSHGEYAKVSHFKLISHILEGCRPEIPQSLQTTWAPLLSRLWHQEPTQRPSFVEICDELERRLESLVEADGTTTQGDATRTSRSDQSTLRRLFTRRSTSENHEVPLMGAVSGDPSQIHTH
mmetsp:Transcript_45564/g.98682  ORF Transcript_45564/g.98682 Transcript_45564/m.98682 type:complete len:206 (-) Transcript_45564:12-629(-)